MRKISMITSLATGLVAACPVIAGQWDGNPDMEYSILNDLDKPVYVGTGLGADRPRIDPYFGTVRGIADFETTGFVVGSAEPATGLGDIYSHVLMATHP